MYVDLLNACIVADAIVQHRLGLLLYCRDSAASFGQAENHFDAERGVSKVRVIPRSPHVSHSGVQGWMLVCLIYAAYMASRSDPKSLLLVFELARKWFESIHIFPSYCLAWFLFRLSKDLSFFSVASADVMH